tara:strand:- start:2650 stop:2961 length:312 start_codon:yes stop_codon:yes gene_type:complete
MRTRNSKYEVVWNPSDEVKAIIKRNWTTSGSNVVSVRMAAINEAKRKQAMDKMQIELIKYYMPEMDADTAFRAAQTTAMLQERMDVRARSLFSANLKAGNLVH